MKAEGKELGQRANARFLPSALALSSQLFCRTADMLSA